MIYMYLIWKQQAGWNTNFEKVVRLLDPDTCIL